LPTENGTNANKKQKEEAMFERIGKSLVLSVAVVCIAVFAGCGKSRTAQDWHDQGMLCLTLAHDTTGEKAIDYFSRAIKKDPSLVKSYNCRGVAYIQSWIKRAASSAGDLEELKKGVPLDQKTKLAQEMIAKARADFQKALDLDPKYDLARGNLAKLDKEEYGEVSGVEY
jgi:tetratricopeptide (TPR) repeat protein